MATFRRHRFNGEAEIFSQNSSSPPGVLFRGVFLFRRPITPMLSQPVLYLLVGGFCTASGMGIIFLLMACKVGAVASNAIGYAAGLAFSFVLNSAFTFRSRMRVASLARFLLVASVAYVCNLATFFLVHTMTGNNSLAQIAGMPVYTVVGYLLNKYWALVRA